jgi:hypothetical protein
MSANRKPQSSTRSTPSTQASKTKSEKEEGTPSRGNTGLKTNDNSIRSRRVKSTSQTQGTLPSSLKQDQSKGTQKTDTGRQVGKRSSNEIKEADEDTGTKTRPKDPRNPASDEVFDTTEAAKKQDAFPSHGLTFMSSVMTSNPLGIKPPA